MSPRRFPRASRAKRIPLPQTTWRAQERASDIVRWIACRLQWHTPRGAL